VIAITSMADTSRIEKFSTATPSLRIKEDGTEWHLLKPKSWPLFSKTLMHQESDYGQMTGGRFGECLGGCAACGLLRQICPQPFDLSLAEQISWEYA
jgi:hypothetical protein